MIWGGGSQDKEASTGEHLSAHTEMKFHSARPSLTSYCVARFVIGHGPRTSPQPRDWGSLIYALGTLKSLFSKLLRALLTQRELLWDTLVASLALLPIFSLYFVWALISPNNFCFLCHPLKLLTLPVLTCPAKATLLNRKHVRYK